MVWGDGDPGRWSIGVLGLGVDGVVLGVFVVGLGRGTREVRFREMLGEALKGNRGAGLFAVAPRGGGADVGGGGAAVDVVATDALASSDGATSVVDVDAARRPSMPQGRKSSTVVVA